MQKPVITLEDKEFWNRDSRFDFDKVELAKLLIFIAIVIQMVSVII